nr:MAG TPA: hypothetical protein [Caudoviricetes sp.]
MADIDLAQYPANAQRQDRLTLQTLACRCPRQALPDAPYRQPFQVDTRHLLGRIEDYCQFLAIHD